MHKIIAEDRDVQEALQALQEAAANRAAYVEKVAAARAQFDAAQQAALDRGEVHCPPLQVVEDEAVTRHLAELEERAVATFAERAGRAGARLIPLLEAREAELLAGVGKARVSELDRIGAEVGELAAAKAWLHSLVSWQPFRGMPTTKPAEATAYAPEKVVEAARTGGTLIGRTPPPAPPAPAAVDMLSAEGEALMGANGITSGRLFA